MNVAFLVFLVFLQCPCVCVNTCKSYIGRHFPYYISILFDQTLSGIVHHLNVPSPILTNVGDFTPYRNENNLKTLLVTSLLRKIVYKKSECTKVSALTIKNITKSNNRDITIKMLYYRY